MSNIGRKLYGYCDGYFGRDSYGDKIIEAEGYDWIVAREYGEPIFAFVPPEDKAELMDRWSVEKEPDYY